MKPEYKKTKYVIPDWDKVQNRNLTKGKVYRIRKWSSPGSFRIYDDFNQAYVGSVYCWRDGDFETNLQKILEE